MKDCFIERTLKINGFVRYYIIRGSTTGREVSVTLLKFEIWVVEILYPERSGSFACKDGFLQEGKKLWTEHSSKRVWQFL